MPNIERALIVAGLGFGDEGKGSIVDYLTREHGADLVVRYNGGSQAAHNVIAEGSTGESTGGVHHTFSQVGAGTFAGAATFLSRHMLIDPIALRTEMAVLAAKGYRPHVTLDPDAVVITPYHVETGRERERRRGSDRHGSVGSGVGEARGDEIGGRPTLRVGDLLGARKASAVLAEIREGKLAAGLLRSDFPEYSPSDLELPVAVSIAPWATISDRYRCVVFEGAQGVLLDERWGFPPFHTWTDCTFNNAEHLLREAGFGLREFAIRTTKIGVSRIYSTRHGAGPFPTEDRESRHPETHNGTHPWMGPFRQGPLDLTLLSYACEVTGPHMIALTHCDRFETGMRVGVGYEGFVPRVDLGAQYERGTRELFNAVPRYGIMGSVESLMSIVAERTGVPIGLLKAGPTADEVIEGLN